MRLAIGFMVSLSVLMAPAGPATADASPAELAARYERTVDRRLTLPADEVQRYGALALKDRGRLFAEATDEADPWQFLNIRVT